MTVSGVKTETYFKRHQRGGVVLAGAFGSCTFAKAQPRSVHDGLPCRIASRSDAITNAKERLCVAEAGERTWATREPSLLKPHARQVSNTAGFYFLLPASVLVPVVPTGSERGCHALFLSGTR